MPFQDTLQRHAEVMQSARNLFNQKKTIYGDSWQMMDIHYIADRMMVKCQRITQLLTGKEAQVDEGVPTELTDIINYAVIGLMRIKKEQESLNGSLSDEQVEALYDKCVEQVRHTLTQKNHDYNDAWMTMRYGSLITQLKVKLSRILNEEEADIANDPTSAIDQFQDIVNYAVFALLHPLAPYNLLPY
ncbi:MAG: DUF1599 domain-containing protein [Bacteroidota bacterium]